MDFVVWAEFQSSKPESAIPSALGSPPLLPRGQQSGISNTHPKSPQPARLTNQPGIGQLWASTRDPLSFCYCCLKLVCKPNTALRSHLLPFCWDWMFAGTLGSPGRAGQTTTCVLPPASFLACVLGTVPAGWGGRGSEVQRDTPEKTLATVSWGINPSDPRGQPKVGGRVGAPLWWTGSPALSYENWEVPSSQL